MINLGITIHKTDIIKDQSYLAKASSQIVLVHIIFFLLLRFGHGRHGTFTHSRLFQFFRSHLYNRSNHDVLKKYFCFPKLGAKSWTNIWHSLPLNTWRPSSAKSMQPSVPSLWNVSRSGSCL